jgi:hypothetical protein
MGITKRHVDVSELLGLFLNFTPQSAEADFFRADMRILNPVLLKDSLKECRATARPDQGRGMAQRAEIHRVYARKTKELASLYPFIFSLENALRHAAAAYYADVFGSDSWWTIIRDKCESGQNEAGFHQDPATRKKNIRGVLVNPKFVDQLCRAFCQLTKRQKASLAGSDLIDEFYLCLPLGSLFSLIEADFELARDMFVSEQCSGKPLKKSDFVNWFKIIREARNELYHSRSIGDISKVARACENTLDKLGFHLRDFDSHVANTRITRPFLTIERVDYHLVPPPL